ncbi:hypothetical protein A2954_00925 [Candidatus Roizmanbacteria bacterium RIFCSPLOWO2_01_FULL_37_12]|uniref:Uncharacterized protein n=1 Tax=Candidatus Roizmanbacteria bacterium RIFCSPLOWO2_01_FULL_37_12 TaxID=1802056 RepID=A0A1F7IGA6_9BACT|nr:MAG: hypothetical protein A3D76_06925 [Candidatus Roizmanbacteria bacterium RIFCSPHIGHO2_02_FULL_37_9b]OGK42391.1 MAG: hypothetical protein A2954_00925 [Candidatus Roizmanbacteria bacterium RIFCSPLOWO2_01_FULL_37_12]
MFKNLVIIGIIFAVLVMIVTPTLAAKPASQACLGTDISGFAQNGQTVPADFEFEAGAGWGGFISGVATSPGADGHVGVAGEINAHQAGFILDFVIPNSCN